MGVGGQRHALAASHPWMGQCPVSRRLVGSQGRSGRVRKLPLPWGLDPRTKVSEGVQAEYPWTWDRHPVSKHR